MPDPSPEVIAKFIERWEKSGGSEMANYQLFLTELCDEILLVPHPEPAGPDNAANLYTFERGVTFKDSDGSQAKGRIDLYKSTCFVLETKQGTFSKAKEQGTLLDFIPAKAKQKTGHGKRGTAAFDKVLQRAYNQGRKYITALPAAEGRPPFLIVCDVGHSIELYAEFTGTGGQYERFPDPVSHRITLADLVIRNGGDIAEGGHRLFGKPGGLHRLPRVLHFLVRVDAGDLHDVPQGVEGLSGQLLVVSDRAAIGVGVALGIDRVGENLRRVDITSDRRAMQRMGLRSAGRAGLS
jgi:hypothetical protein